MQLHARSKHPSLLLVCLVLTLCLSSSAKGQVLVHTVKPGDNLTRLAEMYGTTVENLVALNGLTNPDTIRIGQELVVGLAPIIHVVQPGESLWTIAHAHGVTTDAILRFNDLPNPDHVLPGQRLVIPPAGGSDAAAVMALQGMGRREELLWPVKGGGIISSLFGPRQDRLHKGLDIAAPTGTPILAAADGRVTYADWAGTYGMLVVIDHGDGLLTRYAHASAIHVKVGQQVRAGQHIADVGNTGRSTGPHLHFEVERSGEVIDPLLVLPAGVGR